MKQLHTKLLTAGAAAGGALALTLAVAAGPVSALATGRVSARCALVETRLGSILAHMQTVDERREAAYQNAVTRVKNQLQNAKDAGYDTTQLQADYSVLNADIKQHHTDRLQLEADLSTAEAYAPVGCGTSAGVFVGDLQTARRQLKVVRGDDQKIRADLAQHIRPDLQAYITWLKQQATKAASA